jgi:hypothetical protein
MSRSSFDDRAWGPTPSPRDEELLTSWLTRVAASHGQSFRAFVVDRLGVRAHQKDLDRAPGALITHRILAAGRVSDARLRAMTLQDWQPKLGLRAVSAGVAPWILVRGARYGSHFHHGLQVCLRCLMAGSGLRRQWRMAFVVGCIEHDGWLVDACGACNAPLSLNCVLAGRRVCLSCRRHLVDQPCERGTFSSGPADLQRWLVQALDRDELLDLGPTTITLAEVLLGFRFLVRLENRWVGAQDRVKSVELMRHSERVVHLERIASLLSRWPDGVYDLARKAGISRDPFPGEHCPDWILKALSILRAPRPRQGPAALLEDPILKKLRRKRPAHWRSRYARRLVKLVGRLP